ncbi:MAG: zinc-binding dehydrogenase [Lewinellaceae bacterium]|nr:zinc-binding dehydrogenase [Lewinellaceae bacterium]
MKALVLKAKDVPLSWEDFPGPTPQAGEVVVEPQTAALNHRDVWITKGLYPGIVFPGILGSDGAGMLAGREVLINPNIGWGPNPRVQKRSYSILGMPKHGTMAEKVSVGEDRVHDKPPHLSWEEAAALPLAGMTAYRALFSRGALEAGEKVLITGIGGGVALFALQFALAAGAEVYVTSSSGGKIARAMEMGASGGAGYTQNGWEKELANQAGGFNLILDSAGGAGFSFFPKLCHYGARIVSYGGSKGAVPNFTPQSIFWKQISILGSTMASDEEFAEMLAFVSLHRIHPVIDSVYPITRAEEAFERLARGEQFGKVVFRVRD